MTLQIVGQTIEAGEPVYLVSIDGEHPEPMSKQALREFRESALLAQSPSMNYE